MAPNQSFQEMAQETQSPGIVTEFWQFLTHNKKWWLLPILLAMLHAVRSSPPAGATLELLKVLLKAKSDNAGVASKLIATVADLEKIAVDDEADVEALHGWRRQLFGDDALKLKRGEIALVLNGPRVEVVEIEG